MNTLNSIFFRLILLAFVTLCYLSCNRGLNNIFGANISQEFPVGGGEGYKNNIEKKKCHYIVRNVKELALALNKSTNGDCIYIEDNAEIDMASFKNIQINKSITLCSGRGVKGSEGALLFSKEEKTDLFIINASNVRFSGLRINGPDTLVRYEEMLELDKVGKYYDKPLSRAILTNDINITTENLEIDNCEIWGWSHTAIFLRQGSQNSKIHHNFIHHNRRHGLGYGICLDASSAKIYSNKFDYNRHDINGTGRSGTAYEAYNNIILANGNGHSFDMHGGGDRDDGTSLAGNYVNIHHNTFYSIDYPAFFLRGTPKRYAKINNNLFYHTGNVKTVLPLRSRSEPTKVEIKNNKYSKSQIRIDSLIIRQLYW